MSTPDNGSETLSSEAVAAAAASALNTTAAVDDDDDAAADDEGDGSPAMVYQYPLKGNRLRSQCGVCSYLNPSIEGVLLRSQLVQLLGPDKKPVGKKVRAAVWIKPITPKDCAPSRNDDCPARGIRLVVGENVDVLARRYVRATSVSNWTAVAEIAAHVTELEETLQTAFNARVKELTNADPGT